jgi:hypothetical protein
MDGDNAIQALAERMDTVLYNTLLGQNVRFGTATITPDGNGDANITINPPFVTGPVMAIVGDASDPVSTSAGLVFKWHPGNSGPGNLRVRAFATGSASPAPGGPRLVAWIAIGH